MANSLRCMRSTSSSIMMQLTKALRDTAAHGSSGSQMVGFIGHRYSKTEREWQFLVHWLGYEPKEPDATWEPLGTLVVDVPVRVQSYARTIRNASDRSMVMAAVEELSAKLADSPLSGGEVLCVWAHWGCLFPGLGPFGCKLDWDRSCWGTDSQKAF